MTSFVPAVAKKKGAINPRGLINFRGLSPARLAGDVNELALAATALSAYKTGRERTSFRTAPEYRVRIEIEVNEGLGNPLRASFPSFPVRSWSDDFALCIGVLSVSLVPDDCMLFAFVFVAFFNCVSMVGILRDVSS